MDTVSMLNTMRFYCQPILPLVYDESMSYYETLCKVVGQLNNTGETVNKLNEGLTGEIAGRQAGDAALDKRIKELENTCSKIHFLKVDTLGHLLTPDINREKLSQWVQNGDLIAMLYAPDDMENSWAVATNYRSMGATGADTMQLNFYVPISIVNNAGKSGLDVEQEVVVISLPVGELTNQWVVRTITSTIPNTNADGFVNLMASVSDAGAVTCDVEPGAIVEALRNYFSGTNQFAVAVNARLNYDGKQYHSGAATVKADTSGAGNIRIAFENYYDGVRAENGVRQTVNTTIFLVGDVKTNTWSVETIDHKTFDFSRYESFQFTRGAHDVITTDDESTPNAVYAHYHSGTSGKLYQNLPTRLIDTVDGAEYWNGTFDIYGGNHMTFTFVTSNYATSSDKMLVRVIELSADVGTTAWKYGVKEFELPFVGYDLIAVTSTKVTDLGYDASEGAHKFAVTFDASFDSILANLAANKPMKFNITIPDSTGGLPLSFTTGYVSYLGNAMYEFTGTLAGAPVVLSIGGLGSASVYLYADYLPSPNPDDSDDGKVLTVNKHKWEMKTPTGGGSSDSVLYTPQTLTDAQKKQARENVDAASDFVINATVNINLTLTLDKTWAQINEAVNAGKTPVLVMPYGVNDSLRLQLLDTFADGTGMVFSNAGAASDATMAVTATVRSNGINSFRGSYLLETDLDGVLPQISMASAPASDMQIATKKYVDDKIDGARFKYFTYDARAATADMTPAEVKAFITANPHTPIYMRITGIDTGTRPIWAVQQSWANDTVVFVSTSITRTTGVQEYKLVKAASDTAWGAISTGRLVTDDTPSVANPTFAEDIDGHANIVLGIGEDSSASNENLPYLATGDYPKGTIDGVTWSDLRLYNGVFAYRDISIDSLYNKVLDGTMLPDIDFVLSNAVLIGTVEGEITNYTNGYYNIIKDEISRNRGNIWLSFNGETIRLASWKQAGSDTYALTFFGAGAAAQPVKYVVTASASSATLTVTGS